MNEEFSARGGNRRGGRTGHLAVAQRRTILALKSTQMLVLEQLDNGSPPPEDLEKAEAALKEALRHFSNVSDG